MKKIEVDKIKSKIVTEELPEIMESIDTSIIDDSKEFLEETVGRLKKCNNKMKSGLKDLNTYIDGMAEAFEKTDKEASKYLEDNVQE